VNAYANDLRVRRVGPDEFVAATESGVLWSVRREDGVWNAYVGDDTAPNSFDEASGKATAGEAIARLIGDPR
jgi:hypothetical protein